ncbi:MAG TPA: hypothetical protein VFF73_03890 [Planctomycetota bacterium]|nr:hypothetical protein [Planctomycetota bacterium]
MFEVAEELSIEIKDEPGSLAAVLAVVAKAGCAVRAFCGYSMGGAGNVMVVADDAKKAKAALKKAGYKEIESSKVVVGTTKDKKGAGATITEMARAKGINLDYAYATGTGKGTGVIVLAAGDKTAQLAKALNA